MIIEFGLIAAAGLALAFYKCDWHWRIRMLSNPVLIDLLVFGLLLLIHAGTFSGVMVATVGALVSSGLLTLGRYVYGHSDTGQYVAGAWVDLSGVLAQPSAPVLRPILAQLQRLAQPQ